MRLRCLVPSLLVVLALTMGTWPEPCLGGSTGVLSPRGRVERVGVGKAQKIYYRLGPKGIRVPVKGPGHIKGYARIAMAPDASDPVAGTLHLDGVPGATADIPLTFRPSPKTPWGEPHGGVPSGGRRFDVDVPAGKYSLKLSGKVANGETMLVILYYDGPAQPGESSPVAWVGNASVDVIYNDNILSNSPGYNDDFTSGSYPWKFINKSQDDMIIAPAFDIEARTGLVPWGQSRLKFKVKRWMYANNPIKTNTDFHFYLRQYFGSGKSLELYFHFAPEQYIRQLSDRSPLADRDSPIQWKQFRFQRNVWNATWRQKISKRFSAKVLYEENYRYYNQPFMENDIEAWEVRGNVTWRMSPIWVWNFDYSYEDATSRAVDMQGETPEDSDNSDSSYQRDLYRIGLDIRHPWFRKAVDRIGLSFLFMDYYYTTTKNLVEDPYHAGRRDRFYKGTLEARRKVAKSLTLKLAVRRTERVVNSPWEGEITTDKGFVQWLYWTSLNYRF